MIKAVIFDADGPLYYRTPEVIEQQLALLNKYGYPEKLSHGQVAHLNKYGHLGSLDKFDAAYDKEKFKAYVRAESVHAMVQHILHSIGLELSGEKLQQFARELKKLHERVTARPDAIPALKRLKQQGYSTCVLTDSFYSSQEKWRWFESMGMAEFLDYMVSSYDIRVLKDTPEAYRACLKELGVSADEAVFAGHQQYEMTGAKAANIRSIAVLPIASKGIRSDYSIDLLSELPDLLDKINRDLHE